MTTQDMETRDGPASMPRLVWDLPLRVAHWMLALNVAGAWATHYAGTRWFAWHRWLGYSTLVLVAFRIVWGFVGTRHARFAAFVRGPGALVEYLRGRPLRETPGHNPLGALSVLAMLAALLFQATTGLFANDQVASAGPFYGWIGPGTSNRITGLHQANSILVLSLVALHVGAIAWYGRVAGRPLVRAMITGRKPAADVPSPEAIDNSRTLLALAVVAALAIGLMLAVRAAPEATIALY
jgi:cytochrome b